MVCIGDGVMGGSEQAHTSESNNTRVVFTKIYCKKLINHDKLLIFCMWLVHVYIHYMKKKLISEKQLLQMLYCVSSLFVV